MKCKRSSDGRTLDKAAMHTIRTQAVKAVREGFQVAETARVFRQFLERFMAGVTKPIFVSVDGHPAHRSKLLREFVASTNRRLRLFFPPPYSPHLNPDEQTWAHVKREVSSRGVDSLGEMNRPAVNALRRLQKLPSLMRAFFRQSECMNMLADFTSWKTSKN